jgi:hypothetical protein
VSCAWVKVGLLGDWQGENIVRDCIIKHEDDHHDAISCSSRCPSLSRPPSLAFNNDWEECDAYKVEYNCLKSKFELCRTNACKAVVNKRIAQIILYAYGTYGKCDITKS